MLAEAMVHCSDNAIPEFFAAFLVNCYVPNHRKLPRPRRDPDKHSVSFARLLHAQAMKFFLRRDQWVCVQLAALDVNANLARSF